MQALTISAYNVYLYLNPSIISGIATMPSEYMCIQEVNELQLPAMSCHPQASFSKHWSSLRCGERSDRFVCVVQSEETA